MARRYWKSMGANDVRHSKHGECVVLRNSETSFFVTVSTTLETKEKAYDVAETLLRTIEQEKKRLMKVTAP